MAIEPVDTNEGIFSKSKAKCCIFTSTKIFIVFLGFVAVGFVAGYFVYFIKDVSKSQEYNECNYENSRSYCETNQLTNKSSLVSAETEDVKSKKYVNKRLPRSIKPLHYHIKLKPFINGNFSILGHVAMTFEVLENTSNVTLHINGIITHNNTIKLSSANDRDNNVVLIVNHVYDLKKQFYIAMLSEELKAGKKYVLSMDYTGFLNDNMNGFYRSSYTDEFGNTRWIAATQFQPTDARKAFPCLDEPGFKANFSVEIARETNMSSISNMPLRESVPIKQHPDWVWDIYETTLPMSTYLVAFVVSDFTYKKSVDDNPYEFRVWARKSAIDLSDYALKMGQLVTKFFESYLEVPFSLPKQDMIALPEFAAGAMENWGLVTYRETAMLYDPKTSRAVDKQSISKTIVHEIAHQWFGNLVTLHWWTGIWLNEGFAGYMEYVGLHGVEPRFEANKQFVIDKIHAAFTLDSLESSHPIYFEVEDPNQSNGAIPYLKGASVLRMMNHFLGENTFRKGISNYLRDMSYLNAEQDDLWKPLTEQASIDGTLPNNVTVKTIMDTWTLQTGFPLVTVTRNEDGSVTLKQERFLNGAKENSTDQRNYRWWIPISFASKINADFSVTKPVAWMQPSDHTKTLSGVFKPNDEWAIFNIQQTGFYRVNYDEENWNAIIRQLKIDHTLIHPINRAQIIDDSLSLARAGLLSYDTVMSILSYLKLEEDFVPWQAALKGLDYIADMFAHTGGYGALKEFTLNLITPIYNKVGFYHGKTDLHLTMLMRASILSKVCKLGYEPCVREASSLFNQWLQHPNNDTLIPPNLKSVVYCTAIKNGDHKEWNFVWQKYENSSDASDNKLYIAAMGCSKESWILNGYLDRAVTEGRGVLKQDSRSVIAAVASNEHGKLIAWEFFKENFRERILKLFGDSVFNLSGVVKAVTKSLNKRNQLKELRDFMRENEGMFGSAELAIQQSEENVENNLHWMNTHYDIILKWLTENGYDKSTA